MNIVNKVEVEAFLALIDALRVRGVTSIKCDAFEVSMVPFFGEPEHPATNDDEDASDEELLFYSAR